MKRLFIYSGFWSYFFLSFRIHSKARGNLSTWICLTTAWANCSPISSPTSIGSCGSTYPTTTWVKFMGAFLQETASWEYSTWTTINSLGSMQIASEGCVSCADSISPITKSPMLEEELSELSQGKLTSNTVRYQLSRPFLVKSFMQISTSLI